jgi:hypothetical protein
MTLVYPQKTPHPAWVRKNIRQIGGHLGYYSTDQQFWVRLVQLSAVVNSKCAEFLYFMP